MFERRESRFTYFLVLIFLTAVYFYYSVESGEIYPYIFYLSVFIVASLYEKYVLHAGLAAAFLHAVFEYIDVGLTPYGLLRSGIILVSSLVIMTMGRRETAYYKNMLEEKKARGQELESKNTMLNWQKYQLTQSRRHLSDMLNSLPDAVMVVDAERKVTFWNDAMEQLTGVRREEIVGKVSYECSSAFYGRPRPLLLDFMLGDNSADDDMLRNNYKRILQKKDHCVYETFASKLNSGEGADLLVSFSKLYGLYGEPSGGIESVRDITDLKRAQSERKYLSRLLENMFDEHAAAMVIVDPETDTITDVNPSALSFYGYEKEEIIGRNVRDIYNSPDMGIGEWKAAVLDGERECFLAQGRLKNDDMRMVDIYSSAVHYGGSRQIFSIIFDVTDREIFRENLYREKEMLSTTLCSIGDGVLTTDSHGYIVSLNKAGERLLGKKSLEIEGQGLEDFFAGFGEASGKKIRFPFKEGFAEAKKEKMFNKTLVINQDNGKKKYAECTFSVIRNEEDDSENGAVLVFHDITEDKKKQARVEYLSFHDQLTGLYNRRFFDTELKRLDTERNLPMTIVMADVNGLKLANDAFGHKSGDEILKRFSRIMKRHYRSDDIIARLGGDEFVIILPKTDYAQAAGIIDRINSFLEKEKVGSINLSVAHGWASKTDKETDISVIWKKAEDRMYGNKLGESASFRHKTVDVIMETFYEKSAREKEHSERVSHLCVQIGAALGMSAEKVSELQILGLMHDIGKIAVDYTILDKPGALDEEEGEEIRKHPETGYRILNSVDEFSKIAGYVLAHHERLDGSGYPKGLKGEEIPFQARIIAVADSYDAMTSARTYRAPMSSEAASRELARGAGIQFDAEIVRVFLDEVLAVEDNFRTACGGSNI